MELISTKEICPSHQRYPSRAAGVTMYDCKLAFLRRGASGESGHDVVTQH